MVMRPDPSLPWPIPAAAVNLLAEYERMVLEANAWGAEHVVMLHAERVRRVVGSVG